MFDPRRQWRTRRRLLGWLVAAILLLATLTPVAGATPDAPGQPNDWEEVPWAQAALADMRTRGVIRGYGDGSLRPQQAVTRAELAVMVVRLLGLEAAADQPEAAAAEAEAAADHAQLAAFNLADAGAIPAWARPQVTLALQNGLLHGRWAEGGPVFAGEQPASRAEVTAVLARAAGLPGESTRPVPGFVDGDQLPAWARGTVDAAVEAGIVRGYPDGSFRPAAPVSRAELAVLLSRTVILLPPLWPVPALPLPQPPAHDGGQDSDGGGQDSDDGAAQQPEPAAESPLSLTLTATPKQVAAGQAVTLTLTVENTAGHPVEIEYTSGQSYDFGVDGPVQWRWASDMAFTMAMRYETWQPGATRTFSFTWPAVTAAGEPAPAGSYTATARFTGRVLTAGASPEPAAPVPFQLD